MPGRGFQYHHPLLNTASNNLSNRASSLRTTASSARSNTLASGSLSSLAGGVESTLNSHIGRVPSSIDSLAEREEGHSSRLRANSDAMQATDDEHASRLSSLADDIHPSTTNVHQPAPVASSSRPPKSVSFNPNTTVHQPNPDGTTTTSSAPLDGSPSSVTHRPPFNPGTSQINNPSITGAGTSHVAGPLEAGAHPLRVGDQGLTAASYNNGSSAMGLSNRLRPGMGGSLLIGDGLIPHSSMKNGNANRHSVVQQALDNIPEDQRGRGHGQCAEVGAISNYLHEVDPNQQWDIPTARKHFDQVGAATAAHVPAGSVPAAPPCASCEQMTGQLGISWITRPISETDSSQHI